MFLKIYDRVVVKDGALVPVECVKITGLTSFQADKVKEVLCRHNVMHEVGDE